MIYQEADLNCIRCGKPFVGNLYGERICDTCVAALEERAFQKFAEQFRNPDGTFHNEKIVRFLYALDRRHYDRDIKYG